MIVPGTVIILNGPSSTGKSSIQKEIQDSFDQPYLAMGIDSLLARMVPARYFSREVPDGNEVLAAETAKDLSGAPLFTVLFGPKGRQFVSGMHHAIASFAACGNNVVVDYILYEEEWLQELVDVLHGVTVYFVGVRAPLARLEIRERQRSHFPAGAARAHYDVVHKHGVYDLELDTSLRSAQECAEEVRQYISTQPSPTAFRRLRERFELK